MMTRLERITGHIAGGHGLILASLVHRSDELLWPEMRLAGLIIFLLFWLFTSVALR